METTIKYTVRILSMAALVAMGGLTAGCSSEDDITAIESVSTHRVITQTVTVNLDGNSNGTTRALTADGVKTFAVGDQIAVVYTNTSEQFAMATSLALTAEDITNSGKSASFTITLTNPKPSGDANYVYPASMATTSTDMIDYSQLDTQDGTLASLASALDVCIASTTLTATGGLPTEAATLSNQLAICAFTLKDYGGTNDLTSSITQLTMSDGTNTYTVNRSAAAGPIYVAIQPTDNATITYTATDGTNSYTKTVSGKTYADGNIYPLGLRMFKLVNLANINANYTAQNGEALTGTLDVANYPVQISIAAGATVTLKDVSIIGVHSGSDYFYAGITCEGDATINLEGTNTVKGFNSSYPGILPGRSGTTLTIQSTSGTGKLTASSNGYGAGIGAGFRVSCGNITIESGIIEAISTTYGAGIGCGYCGTCGAITISGGTVTATGGSQGAGIGCGLRGTCGAITISGGTVTATGDLQGAGIGAGRASGGASTCGAITISGGTVTATGGHQGAGIGAGGAESGYTSTCGYVIISGGTVEAHGGVYAAGIGASFADSNSKSTCGFVAIESGTTQVVATKGDSNAECIGKGVASNGGTSGLTGDKVLGNDADSPITIIIGGTGAWTEWGYYNETAIETGTQYTSFSNLCESSESTDFTWSTSGNTFTLTHK